MSDVNEAAAGQKQQRPVFRFADGADRSGGDCMKGTVHISQDNEAPHAFALDHAFTDHGK